MNSTTITAIINLVTALLPTLEAGAGLSARWEAAGVGPLRAARRAMKPEVPGLADAAREALRAEVKALELQAEQLLIETLEALAPPKVSDALPLKPALAAAADAWPAKASAAAFDRLAQTLSYQRPWFTVLAVLCIGDVGVSADSEAGIAVAA